MERIGVRELRQHASRWLRRVAAGESFDVTLRGRPVARLVPPAQDAGVDALVEAGRLRPGRGRIEDSVPPDPPAGPTATEVLREARDGER